MNHEPDELYAKVCDYCKQLAMPGDFEEAEDGNIICVTCIELQLEGEDINEHL